MHAYMYVKRTQVHAYMPVFVLLYACIYAPSARRAKHAVADKIPSTKHAQVSKDCQAWRHMVIGEILAAATVTIMAACLCETVRFAGAAEPLVSLPARGWFLSRPEGHRGICKSRPTCNHRS